MCDAPGCDAVYTDDEQRWFNGVWEQAKTHGWRARKICHVWCHFCPVHADK